MTNDLETMLRASLHERADDVEPTPELWRSVQQRVTRRRAMPLLVWTAAGVAAAVTAVAVVPGVVERMGEGVVIDPAQSPTAPTSPGEDAPGAVAAAPLTSYVAVVDGRLLLRSVDGSEGVLWEGESRVRTVAVRPGSTADEPVVAAITTSEGMLDLRVLGDGTDGAVFLGPDAGDAAVVPTPVWSPDGSTVATVVSSGGGAELVLVDVASMTAEGQGEPSRVALGDLRDPSQLRVQDWAAGDEQVLSFTSLGTLYRSTIERSVDGSWIVSTPARADGDASVVDIATTSDGTQYRLLAGGSSSGDAEDAGLALEFDNERIVFADLATASPSDAWMTAIDGGAIVGLGDDARLVVRDPEGDSPVTRIDGVSYAAWIPGSAGPGGPATAPTTDAGTSATADVLPYVAIDGQGRLAVHTGDGGREVILDEQLWSPQAGVRVMDASVRPGSGPGGVAGVALLATEGGPELLWFRAAAGATATSRMEGATGLGNGDTDQLDAPTWSPDGRSIAWTEPDGDGGWTLRTVRMADDGPTSADAGFGIEAPGSQSLRVAAWVWDEVVGGTARGRLLLIDEEETPSAGSVLPIERQGDGALAVTGPAEPLPGADAGSVAELGERDGSLVLLIRTADGWVLSQDAAETAIPLPVDSRAGDLDLDVLEHGSVVTHRRTGEAYVVDRAGGAAPLEVDPPGIFGFDAVR